MISPYIGCLTYFPPLDDSPAYLCVGTSNSILLLGRDNAQIERTWTGHTNAVTAMVYLDGELWSGSADGSIRIWRTDVSPPPSLFPFLT